MGTTVWVDDATRADLRRLQAELGADSVNATIRRLIERPSLDARSLFALHRDAVQAIMARHGIRRLVAFGSRARGDAGPASDLDLAAEFDAGADPLAPLAAEADLEDALGVPVRVVDGPGPGLTDVIAKEGVPFAG